MLLPELVEYVDVASKPLALALGVARWIVRQEVDGRAARVPRDVGHGGGVMRQLTRRSAVGTHDEDLAARRVRDCGAVRRPAGVRRTGARRQPRQARPIG